jgi:hypothetical protein
LNALCALRRIDQEAHRDLVMEVKALREWKEHAELAIVDLTRRIGDLDRYGITDRDLTQAFESHMASWQHEVRL